MRTIVGCVLGALVLAACGGDEQPPLVPPPPPEAAPPPSATASASAEPPKGEAPADAGATAPDAAPAGPQQLTAKPVPLPEVKPPASLDYLACDRQRGRVWVPVGNTGSADVYDVAKGAFTRVDGFKSGGKKKPVGPSSASVGDGVVYVGDRFSSEVCSVDATSLKLGKCIHLPSRPDGVSYVGSAKEVWVTTPHDDSIAVLDASHPDALAPKTTIKLDGRPEGYAVDDGRGVFYTNLADKDGTVVIDTKSHRPRATWKPACGEDGPRGVATDPHRGFVFVACTDHLVVLDGAHGGAVLSKLDTGGGVDDIDWLDAHHALYAAAGKAAQLTVATFDDKGQPKVVAKGATAEGARNAVADTTGNAYVADPQHAGILVLPFTAP